MSVVDWQLIGAEQRDGTEIIVGVDIATVWIVRSASWSNGDMWQQQDFENVEEARGWWSYSNSVNQDKLEGIFEPTHWIPCPPPPEVDLGLGVG